MRPEDLGGMGGDPRRYGVLYGLVMGLPATLFPASGSCRRDDYGAVLVASDLARSTTSAGATCSSG